MGQAQAITQRQMSQLERLEAESIYIIREVAAEFDNPVMLYSIGKDSSVLLHLARKAFHPGKLPFPLMHIDTTWKFQDMIEFRDRMARELGFELIVHINEQAAKAGVSPFTHGSKYTDIMKTEALKAALSKHKFDAAFGGARRDEEKSRAKERVFSFRDSHHRWDPKNQRPELWNVYNGRIRQGESIRVFPLSNWTELDIWQYIEAEDIELPSIYYAHRRPVFRRDGMLMAVTDFLQADEGAEVFDALVRYRTVGDATCTAAVESSATSILDVDVLPDVDLGPVREREHADALAGAQLAVQQVPQLRALPLRVPLTVRVADGEDALLRA